jgi:hypothetical protein
MNSTSHEAIQAPALPAVRLQDASLPYLPSPPIAPDSTATARDLTAAMAQRILRLTPLSQAETLRALRAAFPDSPLTLRVAALDLIMRRRTG